MNEAERRQRLQEALRDAVAPREPTPAEVRTAGRNTGRNRGWMLALVVVLGWMCIAWIWLARPAYFFGPPPPPALSPARQEAQLRFAMYLQQRRVEEYLATHGRLPSTLSQTGAVEDSVMWHLTDGGYVITGRYGDLTLELPSGADADQFLGSSLDKLQQ